MSKPEQLREGVDYLVQNPPEQGSEEKLINTVLTGLTDEYVRWLKEDATPMAKKFAREILTDALKSKKYTPKQKDIFEKAIRFIDQPNLI